MKTITTKVIKALNLTGHKFYVYKDTIVIGRIRNLDKSFSFIFTVRHKNFINNSISLKDIIEKYNKKYSYIKECKSEDFIKDIKEFYIEVIEKI